MNDLLYLLAMATLAISGAAMILLLDRLR